MFKSVIKVILIYLGISSALFANTLPKNTPVIPTTPAICTVEQCTELFAAYMISLSKPDIWLEHIESDYTVKVAPWQDPYGSVIKLYSVENQVYQIELELTGDNLGKQYVGSRILWMMNTSYDFTSIFIEEKYKNDLQNQIKSYIVKWAKNIDKIEKEQYQYGNVILTFQSNNSGNQNSINLVLTLKDKLLLLPSVEQLTKNSAIKYQQYQFPDTPYFSYEVDLKYSSDKASLSLKEKKTLIIQEAMRLQKKYEDIEAFNQLIADLKSTLPNGRKGLSEEVKRMEVIQDKYIEQVKTLEETAKNMLSDPDKFLYLLTPPTITPRVIVPDVEKPIIYLYPEQKSDINVQLNYKGEFFITYPTYPKEGWKITAYPDGKLINHADNKEYSYLFWEGKPYVAQYDMTKGFVVKGKDTAKFLQEKLSYLGLTAKEYNEFIVYWLPRMQDNPYNLITFQGKAYEEMAPLIITPKPDSILRIFMVYKPLLEPINIPKPELKVFKRQGFSVIEWGGAELTE